MGYDDWSARGAKRGKCPVAAHPRAGAVSGHDSEMVRCARHQAANVGGDVPIRVPSLSLGSGRESVAGGSAILEMKSRGQAVGVECPIESSGKTRDERCRISCDDRRPRHRRRCRCRGGIRHSDGACHSAALPMHPAVIRKRSCCVKGVGECGSLIENPRVPQPVRHPGETGGGAVVVRVPDPLHCIARVNRH